ncbi:MAG: IS5 family transposase [Cytophagales bacterium]|jgi:transposase|nr:IS5 family transposase [Cytophagales bacterium]
MSILGKDTIVEHIVPLLPTAKRGKKLSLTEKVSLVEAIFYRLKTGCQWRELPVKLFFDKPYSIHTVFYHFNQWSKQGVWKDLWLHLLDTHRRQLDLSSVQLDGSHSRCHKAREAVGFQHRKADESTNLLFLGDNRGILLAVCEPLSGQHHDLFEIEAHFGQLLLMLQAAGIATDGLFLNADAGFDSQNLRQLCESEGIVANIDFNPAHASPWDREEYFDPELYKRRTQIERAFAILDGFKALLVRYEATARNWFCLNLMAVCVYFLRKVIPVKLP